MKKVVYTLWVAAFTASMWVGCNKNNGGPSGGGGGGGSSIQQAIGGCYSVAQSKYQDPVQTCAYINSGRCPSLADFTLNADYYIPPYQLPQRYPDEYSPLQATQYMQNYWINYVNQACSPSDRQNMISRLTSIIQSYQQNGVYGGYNQYGGQYGNQYPYGGSQYGCNPYYQYCGY